MSYSTWTLRPWIFAPVWVFALVGEPALGRSDAALVTDVGSTATLTVEFTAETDSGPLGGADSDSTTVNGTARVSVVPTEPPFTHCRVHEMSIVLGYIEFYYYLRTLRATFTDLAIESTVPFDGTVDGAGSATFASAQMRVTGNAHLYSTEIGLDETIPVDALSDGSIGARLSASGDTITLDRIDLPTAEWDIPPEYLPEGFLSLVVTVDMDEDASNIVFRGNYGPAIPGDGNADGLMDAADYPSFFDCFTGPGATPGVFCGPFLFDEDNDVDLRDLTDFLNAAVRRQALPNNWRPWPQ